jgi:hypothetical protein
MSPKLLDPLRRPHGSSPVTPSRTPRILFDAGCRVADSRGRVLSEQETRLGPLDGQVVNTKEESTELHHWNDAAYHIEAISRPKPSLRSELDLVQATIRPLTGPHIGGLGISIINRRAGERVGRRSDGHAPERLATRQKRLVFGRVDPTLWWPAQPPTLGCARRIPAITRSRITSRSNFAMAPRNVEHQAAGRRGRVDHLVRDVQIDPSASSSAARSIKWRVERRAGRASW